MRVIRSGFIGIPSDEMFRSLEGFISFETLQEVNVRRYAALRLRGCGMFEINARKTLLTDSEVEKTLPISASRITTTRSSFGRLAKRFGRDLLKSKSYSGRKSSDLISRDLDVCLFFITLTFLLGC